MNFDDNTETFNLSENENLSTPPSWNEESLILSRLQQSVRLLSGNLNHDSLGKVLKSMARETARLAEILNGKGLPLTSKLSSSVGNMVLEFSSDVKSVDASSVRTLSHALDCLRTLNTENVGSMQLQKLPIQVLVLDDDLICRKVMQRALGAEFINVVLCETAEHALSCLDAYHFDVVLSDILMPEVDGFAFIKRLRQVKAHENTPVIFVTALNDLVTRSRSRLTGGCDFIAKPIKPAELTVKVIAFAWKSRLARGPESIDPQPGTLSSTVPGKATEGPSPRLNWTRVGVVSIDPEGRIKSINQDGAALLGCSAEDLRNTEAVRYLAGVDEAGNAKGLTVGLLAEQANCVTSTQVRVIRKAGENCSMQMRVSRSGAGNAALFVCLLTANPGVSPTPSS